jgi:hypothetical protein
MQPVRLRSLFACTLINDSPDSALGNTNVSKVHIVYMTHLDIGFTLSARNVCDTYFDTYFPAAFNVSRSLEAKNSSVQYRWTEFPWLILEYLDNAAECAHRPRSNSEIAAMEEAIANDWIIWHGNALNNFLELETSRHLDFSLTLRKVLNNKYNKTHGRITGNVKVKSVCCSFGHDGF